MSELWQSFGKSLKLQMASQKKAIINVVKWQLTADKWRVVCNTSPGMSPGTNLFPIFAGAIVSFTPDLLQVASRVEHAPPPSMV